MPPMFVYGIEMLDIDRRIPVGIASSLEEAMGKMKEYRDDFYEFNP